MRLCVRVLVFMCIECIKSYMLQEHWTLDSYTSIVVVADDGFLNKKFQFIRNQSNIIWSVVFKPRLSYIEDRVYISIC